MNDIVQILLGGGFVSCALLARTYRQERDAIAKHARELIAAGDDLQAETDALIEEARAKVEAAQADNATLRQFVENAKKLLEHRKAEIARLHARNCVLTDALYRIFDLARVHEDAEPEEMEDGEAR